MGLRPPSSAGSGSVAPSIVTAGNLGASRSLPVSAAQETWLVGTLNANHVLTLAGLQAGARAALFITRDQADTTAANTFTLSDGTTSALVPLGPDAGQMTRVDVDYDGTDLNVTIPGAKGRDGINGTGTGDVINPMTAPGDLIRGGTAGAPTRLAKGADGTFLGVVSGALAYTTPPQANEGLMVSGWTAQTMRRTTVRDRTGSTPITAGTLLLVYIRLRGGVPVNNITFANGSVAASTPTNQWFCLTDLAGNVLGKTADDTTNAWAVDALKTLAVSAPYTPTVDMDAYLGLAYLGGTPPNLSGILGSKAAVSASPPILATGGSVTTPAALGASVAVTAVTTGSPLIPWAGVS